MSFSNSNETPRLKSIGRAFKDFHAFTKDHGKQVCDKMKTTEILSSIKPSGNKGFLSSSTRGQVKHQSLEDEDEGDESLLWKNEDQQKVPAAQTGNPKTSSRFGFGLLKPSRAKPSYSSRIPKGYESKSTDDSFGQEDIFDKPKNSRGIRFPFLK